MSITVTKVYGGVTLSSEFGSANEGLAALDQEAEEAGLLTSAEAADGKKTRHRRTKAEIEAAKITEAAKINPPPAQAPHVGQPPQFATHGALTTAAAGAPPPPGAPDYEVDPSWYRQPQAGGAPPPFPGMPPQPQVPPVAPPIAAAAPLAFDPPSAADDQTSAWANYVDQQVAGIRQGFPQSADEVLFVTMTQIFGHRPPNYEVARAWLIKSPSAIVSNVARVIGDAATRLATSGR